MDGPGRRLHIARQARGLPIDAIANQLHLKPAIVAAIERDDYDALPGSVFITGYMRNYAKLLGLDPEVLLDAYRAANPTAEPVLQPRALGTGKQQVGSGHLAVRLMSLVIIAVLAGLAWLWWQNQPRIAELSVDATAPEVDEAPLTPEPVMPSQVSRHTPSAAPTAPAEPRPAPFEVAPAAAPTAPSAETAQPQGVQAPTQSFAAASPTPAAQTTLATAPQAESSPPAEDGAATPDAAPTEDIVLEFTGPCWVDIRDQERKFKLFGEMRKGDRHVLEGKPPYSVILGNASAVEITVAGKPFDLDAIARGNVARFKLDPGQLP
jgi:cytoskeleton protein RodZ